MHRSLSVDVFKAIHPLFYASLRKCKILFVSNVGKSNVIILLLKCECYNSV